MTQSWPQRPSANAEFLSLCTRAMPAAAATVVVGGLCVVVLDAVGLAGLGVALLVVSVIASWFVGVYVWTTAKQAIEDGLPRLSIDDGVVFLPTDEGDKRVVLSGATVQSGWYDQRPVNRSIGAWLHLSDGTHRVTVSCIEDAAPARESGIEQAPGGGPDSEGWVRVHPRDIGQIWLAMKAGGAEHVPWVVEDHPG